VPGGPAEYNSPHKNSRTCFRGRGSRQGEHLPFSCVITVTKLNLVRPFGLRSSEAQIPQIVVNVRNWRKTVETSERMILLHTQEVTGSSPVAPSRAHHSKQNGYSNFLLGFVAAIALR
jgi:hypothetical protein